MGGSLGHGTVTGKDGPGGDTERNAGGEFMAAAGFGESLGHGTRPGKDGPGGVASNPPGLATSSFYPVPLHCLLLQKAEGVFSPATTPTLCPCILSLLMQGALVSSPLQPAPLPPPPHCPFSARGFGVFSRSDAKSHPAGSKTGKRVLFDTERDADEDGLVRGLEGWVK